MRRLITKLLGQHANTMEYSAIAGSVLAVRDKEQHPESLKTTQCPPSRIESLPPEVRHHLLSMLDLRSLLALSFASPTFYQQYRLGQRDLLCTSLGWTLGSATAEAYAVHQLNGQANLTPPDVPGILSLYAAAVGHRYLPLTGRLTQQEAVCMAKYYLHHVWPISKHYACSFMENLARDAGEEISSPQQAITITTTETIRFARATYRFQILCRITQLLSRPLLEDALCTFLSVLEPWEVEELLCFYELTQTVYTSVFDNVRLDLHPDNPRFSEQSRPPTPEGSFDLDTPMSRSCYLEGTALNGLSLLRSVLFQIKNHQDLVASMQQHIRTSYIPLDVFEGIFGETSQASRRETRPSERDRMQQIRKPFPFRGDSEPHAPPLAWTIIWDNTYSNLYGWYTSDELRRWGYVFWDAETLRRTRGDKLLKRQWHEYWDEDPRDTLV